MPDAFERRDGLLPVQVTPRPDRRERCLEGRVRGRLRLTALLGEEVRYLLPVLGDSDADQGLVGARRERIGTRSVRGSAAMDFVSFDDVLSKAAIRTLSGI